MKFNKLIPELSVSNLQKSIEFYINIIGFKVEYERKENNFAFISYQDSQIMLDQIKENEKWEVCKLQYPFGRGINFQIEVDNVEEIYNRLKSNEYKIAFDMEENWYREGNKLLGNKEFLVQDPDGYLLRFCEDLGERNV